MNRAIVTKLTTGDPSLESALIDAVLVGLGISVSRPDRSTLDTLMNRYIKMAPWESAYRIVWRSQCSSVSECPRWPKEFWEQHLTLGTGGTCFESNCALCQQDRYNVFWRFVSIERPIRLNAFADGTRVDHEFNGDIAVSLAQQFTIDENVVRTALKLVMESF